MKEKLEDKIIEIIKILNNMEKGRRFPSYEKVKKNYSELLELIKCKQLKEITEEDFNIIKNCARLILEAPPRDELSEYNLLKETQEIYNIQIQILQIK